MTPSEKNIVKSLVAVAWADGTVKEPEAGMIDSLLWAFGASDEDEAELAESYELPGADLSHETLSVEVTPRQTDEFTCTACFLVQHESRRSSPGADLCRDCA